MADEKFYPPVSTLIELDNLPEQLSFIKSGLQTLFNDIYYRDLQYSKSARGDAAFYSLSIVSKKRLDFEIPGTGMFLILNPGYNPGDTSIFPITLSYEWKILSYLRSFNLGNFSFKAADIFDITLKILAINEHKLIERALSVYNTSIDGFVNDVNSYYNTSIPLPSGPNPIDEVVTSIRTEPSLKDSSTVIFGVYLLDFVSDGNTKSRVNTFFSDLFVVPTEDYIKDLILPKVNATLNLGAGLEFPRTMLVPLDGIGGEPIPDENVKTILGFDTGGFSFNTATGIGYDLNLVATLSHPSAIGTTGFEIDFNLAKLDLSKTTNIPEATADGRPDDFIGVFIDEATIKLPPFFNQNSGSSAVIKGRNLLIGTGGLSGTIGLEAINPNDPTPALIGANFGGGFSVELNSVDVSFQQNSIVGSNIRGTLKIPGFKDTTGANAEINIHVQIGTGGEFSVTASEDQGITALRIPDILDVTVKSLSVGRKGGRFFVAVSGAIHFQDMGGFIGQFLPEKIDIQKLLIWQDGQMEYEGGTLVLPNAITMKIGPVELSVTAVGFGSHEQEHQGRQRQYKFFEFSGGISVNPGGVDVRGDGIKFYYTVDNDSGAGKEPHRYIRIQGIGIDLAIPDSTDPENAVLLLKGYLSMKDPKPGNEQAGTEYAGGITFTLPKLKMGGSASMRLNPKVPAFIIDTELELSTALPLGSTGLGIYGFRGLLGQRYVASKSATGLEDDSPWWQYYKAKINPDYKEGVQISKFDQKPGFSLGAGVSLATAMDGGRIFSAKIFFLLSLPEVFLLQGQGQMLKERIGLNDPNDPPFFAMIAISKTSIEAAFGVDYLLPDDENPGSIARVNALIEMGFFFGNSSAWYLNIGKDLPESRRVNARILELFDAYFYFMLSSSGIRAGAGAKFEFNKKFGPLRAELGAYLDVAGKIAFKPKQYGASIQLGGKVGLYIFKFGFAISVDAGLAAEAPKPFIVTGSLKVCIKVLKKDYCAKFEFTWVKDTSLDTGQIALMDRSVAAKALNMITQETFELHTSATSLSGLTPASIDYFTVPMDSYIDMEFLKGVLPSAGVKSNFGGNTQGAKYVDYVSPQKSKSSRVRHEYHLHELNIYSWNGSAWQPYDLYAAATPLANAPFVTSDLLSLKKGYWQYQQAELHNKLRIMAQSPLSFVSQGMGDLIVEELGITDETIFCPPAPLVKTCVDFNAYGRKEKPGEVHATVPSGQVISSNDLLIRVNGQPAEIIFYPNGGFLNALTIQPGDELEVLFPDAVTLISLRLKTVAPNVKIHYYQRTELPELTPGNLPQFAYSLVETNEVSSATLDEPVIYDDAAISIDKVVIESCPCAMPLAAAETSLACDADVSIQAKDLELFLSQVAKGRFSLPISLYAEYHLQFDGVFQGSSLYPAITDDGILLNLSLIASTDSTRHLLISDNAGFSCEIHLQTDAAINWGDVLGYSGIRSYQPSVGMNYTFEIDAHLPGDVIITLQGSSCYPIIECYDRCSLLIYQLCYLKFDDAQHNATLPDQTTVQLETDVMTEGFNESIQPIWRPNTYYAVEVKTEDKLYKDGSSSLITSYANNYIFGFKTKGPIGFFHQGNPTYEHLLSQDREAEFKLASLQYYIDFEKSYPNADGALINAKPLFYVDPELLLFYLKNYVYEFYRNWDTYQNNEEVEIELITTIADPAPDTTLPPAQPIAVTWAADDLPGFIHDAVILDNMIENGNPCVNTTPISPMGVHSVVSMSRLEPLKLYTAIFKARYKIASQSEYAEQEVHRYVFQTSRYESFEEQINSYVLERDETNPSIILKTACFEVPVTVSTAQLATAQAILNNSLDQNSSLRQEYAFDYDKLIQGIFQLRSLHPAVTTEFNLMKDKTTGVLLGVLIRNPEPFNDPKIPTSILQQTVQATSGSHVLDKKVFSKDSRNVFLSNANLNVVEGDYDFLFKYFQWYGNQYVIKDSVALTIQLITE